MLTLWQSASLDPSSEVSSSAYCPPQCQVIGICWLRTHGSIGPTKLDLAIKNSRTFSGVVFRVFRERAEIFDLARSRSDSARLARCVTKSQKRSTDL